MSDTENQRHEQNVAAGLKSSINNPRVSDEAKERATQRLEEMDAENQRHEKNVAAGLKASINNPRVSDEAKDRAAQRLEEMGVTGDVEENENQAAHDAEVHEHRVIAGYKAALKNPRVSEEAKEKARKQLDAYGAEYDE